MARSSCVYVVETGDTPVAGFTVKHELLTWLVRQMDHATEGGLTVWRLRDNPRYDSAPPLDITNNILDMLSQRKDAWPDGDR